MKLSIHAYKGFTLVEAMVALVVLSIGMLGIAALYVESLRSGTSALLRSQAVALASDMADRIRANPTAGAAYAKGIDDVGAVTAACTSTGTGACSVQQMAATDIAQWTQLLDDRNDNPGQGRLGLPQGRGIITVNAGPPVVYTITVQWTESGQVTPSSYTLRLQL